MTNATTRAATAADAERIIELLPRLADYPLPHKREPEMFYAGDIELVRRWAADEAPETFIRVAVDPSDNPVGVAIVTLNEDFFSHGPNAHLEVIALDPVADGSGFGRVLIDEVEQESKARGATTMSLHVLGNNVRARHVYEKIGYDEELIRAVKHFD